VRAVADHALGEEVVEFLGRVPEPGEDRPAALPRDRAPATFIAGVAEDENDMPTCSGCSCPLAITQPRRSI